MCLKLTVRAPERPQWHCSDVFIVTFTRLHTFICFHRWLWAAKCWLSRWIVERNLFWTRTLTPAHLHTSISPSELVIFHYLHFRITIIFTISISGVKVKLVKMKKQDKKVWVWLRYQYTLYIFQGFFSPNIFNPPKYNSRLT